MIGPIPAALPRTRSLPMDTISALGSADVVYLSSWRKASFQLISPDEDVLPWTLGVLQIRGFIDQAFGVAFSLIS